jgi:hypothetical protein
MTSKKVEADGVQPGDLESNNVSWCHLDNKRTARRQRQILHLHRCGTRCVMEALIAVDGGEPLDAVLADFERLPPSTYHARIIAFCDGGCT